MKITDLDARLAVSSQITVADLPNIKAAGFRAIVNNRPDGEETGQPEANALQRAAQDLGLGYTHIPVTPGHIAKEDVEAFTRAIAGSGGRVLAFCRSGARSTKLWELAQHR